MKSKVFYQDFLFENMLITKDGFPDIDCDYCDYVAGCKMLEPGCNLNDKRLFVLLSYLMETTKEEKWYRLEEIAAQLDELIIVDDICLKNSEMEEYKLFYIKAYLWRFSRKCHCCITKK